ncbi:aldo-keto reductase family 1 member C15-like [Paramacrobiotus metropolitanus]|uniref:aldo-keto reductase family 1 member C15-like n=1 Tax=Paramacrobiotus metropolitanus TaxID=2943436 RepID=UPI0024458288|nr:aldo-keto reductase family 1 member C15-like [Paramacrobiotus metropolitanus]
MNLSLLARTSRICRFFTMAQSVPYITFNNGQRAPMLGLGTSQFSFVEGKGPVSSCQGTREAVETAIDIGYRLFDTALVYENEVEIGKAIRNKIADGTVRREDVFVTTKLWGTFMDPARVLDGLKLSLKNLQLDYVDLFLVHVPTAYEYVDDHTFNPRDADGKIRFVKADHAAVWKAMEQLVDQGLTKSIGVSAFNKEQLQFVLDHCRIKPANLQTEGHAYLMDDEIFELCRQHGITVTAFAPLGSPARWMKKFKADDPTLTEDPVVLKIAQKHNKSPAQILIRYLNERGRMAIPRSTSRPHLQENFNVFDFEFAAEEVEALKGLDRKGSIRYFPFDHLKDSPDAPYSVPGSIKNGWTAS